jgi:hypothetical protein
MEFEGCSGSLAKDGDLILPGYLLLSMFGSMG